MCDCLLVHVSNGTENGLDNSLHLRLRNAQRVMADPFAKSNSPEPLHDQIADLPLFAYIKDILLEEVRVFQKFCLLKNLPIRQAQSLLHSQQDLYSQRSPGFALQTGLDL